MLLKFVIVNNCLGAEFLVSRLRSVFLVSHLRADILFSNTVSSFAVDGYTLWR